MQRARQQAAHGCCASNPPRLVPMKMVPDTPSTQRACSTPPNSLWIFRRPGRGGQRQSLTTAATVRGSVDPIRWAQPIGFRISVDNDLVLGTPYGVRSVPSLAAEGVQIPGSLLHASSEAPHGDDTLTKFGVQTTRSPARGQQARRPMAMDPKRRMISMAASASESREQQCGPTSRIPRFRD